MVMQTQRPPVVHREACPMPDVEHALRIRGNRPHTPCRHKFPDGRTAFRRRSFQIMGHPAEGSKCILCRLQIIMYYEEE